MLSNTSTVQLATSKNKQTKEKRKTDRHAGETYRLKETKETCQPVTMYGSYLDFDLKN